MHGHRLIARSRPNVRASVLLDLYGTLVEPDWAALLDGRTSLADRAGVAADAAHRAWDRTHAARMIGTYGSLADDLARIFSEALGGSRASISAELLSELADAERESWRRGVRLCEDAVPALKMLRSAGSRLAIVTNASAEAACVVDALGLRSFVDDVFASCHEGVLKPDLLGVALRKLGAKASDTTLVDDEAAQLDEAARLGIGTILIQRSVLEASAASSSGAHQRVSDLRQVVDLVRPTPA
jgi:HAD superfamily hydrolase (TIGR01509 family)